MKKLKSFAEFSGEASPGTETAVNESRVKEIAELAKISKSREDFVESLKSILPPKDAGDEKYLDDLATSFYDKAGSKKETCEKCGRVLPEHDSLCPNAPGNSDAAQYRMGQI